MLKVNSQKLIVNKSGFSALEMLLALGLIVLLLGAAVLVGFRDQPAKNRNTERRNEVNAIKDALTQWSLNSGTYMPTGIPATATCIGTQTTPTACYNLVSLLVPQYLNKIPEDPKNTNGQADTGYTIYKDTATGEIVIGVSSSMAELDQTIEARRK
ncbi:hypothetical protein A3J20_06430 [Candidatus Gottesmanbacteria bacterium RIFCSPLOWO2_02_FULL_42_29]|nr:MAG: hypothetical protein A3J20_06430 [Candidatus Gottesmanbacteria bacterium RIFCSPLOWO2_02_FULL_42_29]